MKAQRLIDVTYDSLMMAIDIVKPGTSLGDIGHVIQSYVENEFSGGTRFLRSWAGPGVSYTTQRAALWQSKRRHGPARRHVS